MIENPFSNYDNDADFEISSITAQIYTGINKEKNEQEVSGFVDRASSATLCTKRRWYQSQKIKGELQAPRKYINFDLGDMAELVLLNYIEKYCVGPDKLYSEVDFGNVVNAFQINGVQYKQYSQPDYHVKIKDGDLEFTVTGHPDGIAKRNSDDEWEFIECKSSSNWGFKSFKSDGPGDYLNQANTLMMSDEALHKGIRSTRYVYLRKETGHIHDLLCWYDPVIAENVREDFLLVKKQDEISAPFALKETKKKGEYTAQFPCTYCPYLSMCHGSYEKRFRKDQWGNYRPQFIFNKEKK